MSCRHQHPNWMTGKALSMSGKLSCVRMVHFNPIALRTAKTQWSFGCSECNRVKEKQFVTSCLGLLMRKYFLKRVYSRNKFTPRQENFPLKVALLEIKLNYHSC